MLLDNFIFVVLLLKIKPAVHINTMKPLFKGHPLSGVNREKNYVGVGNVSMPATRLAFGYYVL